MLIAVAATGLFLLFTLFTAPLFSMIIALTLGGEEGFKQQVVDSDPYYYYFYYLLRQASAQEESTPPAPPPTLPFTPFSLQQQEPVPEEEGGQPIQEQGVPPSLLTNDTGTAATITPATNDTGGGVVTELPASSSEPPLIAEIITNSTQAVAPATVRFDANITGGTPPYSYNWYVPDIGVIDQDRSITQMFFEPGTFTYILTAIDSRGKTVNDAVQIVISERLSPGGVTVTPEPGGVAPPQEEPIQEPGVPPPTVGEGGDTGRGPQGGVTVEPTDEGLKIIPNATSGYVGDRFELYAYLRDGIETGRLFYWCCEEAGFFDVRACDTSDFPPSMMPGYRAFHCGVFWSSTTGTHEVGLIGEDSEGKRIGGSTQITVKERPQGGAIAPEPGGVAPLQEGPQLPTVEPEPGDVAPPEEGGPIPEPGGGPPPSTEPPTVPEGEETTEEEQQAPSDEESTILPEGPLS
jgi:PKD repeat protein